MLAEEHFFVPYAVSPLPEGPWLVFSPHADDETFGMGGSLIKAASLGIEAHLVVLTDGSLGGETPDLVATRREEVEMVCTALSLKSFDFWEECDRGLLLRDELVSKIMNKIRKIKPATVFFPGPMELHPDHRNASLLVWSALQNFAVKERPTSYSYEISVQNPINTLVDVTKQYQKKRAAMRIYSSQNEQNNYEELVSALDKGRTFSLPKSVGFAEGFYKYSETQLERSLPEVLSGIIDAYLNPVD